MYLKSLPGRILFRLAPLVIVFFSSASCAAVGTDSPTLTELLSLPEVGDPRLSPQGDQLIYTAKVADWDNNRYDKELFLARKEGGPTALTANASGSSFGPRWSPDGRFVAYLADQGSGTQIYRIPADASQAQAQAITAWPGGLLSFDWSPDGKQMALLLVDWPDPAIAQRAEQYGEFEILDEYPLTASLWLADVEAAIGSGGVGPGPSSALRRLTRGNELSVSVFSVDGFRLSYSFSPDGSSIVFSHGKSMNIMDTIHSDISLVDTASGEIRNLVTSQSWDETPLFSPDGGQVLFTRTVIADWLGDKQLMLVPASGGEARAIDIDHRNAGGGKASDTQPLLLDWTAAGINVFFQDKTRQQVFRIDPDSGRTTRLTAHPDTVKQFTASKDGQQFAYLGYDRDSAPEIYWQGPGKDARQISQVTRHTMQWAAPRTEIINWQAPDGVSIEGILYSPAELNPTSPAPLIIVLHGGPRDAENPRRVHAQEYPVQQWLGRGARVLFPNYRGSTAYGEAFRKLTMRNIGRAESTDVIAAVDMLAASGLIEDGRVGIAGHSWGGYLSAFLSASTDRFCVASVGSAITDNRINYVLSPAGVAKEGYLNSLPWEAQALWDETSPVHYVRHASTPTLIQHGDNDQVVPVVNAYEFYRGLRDMGVTARAVIFRQTGHNVSRPKEKLAWMQQNLDWFAHYLWESPCTGGLVN